MLQSLHIENVAVIEKTDIAFGAGLTALTGETGAGKSIVIDAINALLGERITRDVVRAGADRAYIAGVFEDLPESVVALLEELELPPETISSLIPNFSSISLIVISVSRLVNLTDCSSLIIISPPPLISPINPMRGSKS